MKKDIQDIEKILNSFDGIQTAEVKPFFHTRVMARLEKETAAENTWMPVRKPVWVIAVLSCLLMANMYLIFQQIKQTKTTDTSETSSLQNFASEYHLNETTNY